MCFIKLQFGLLCIKELKEGGVDGGVRECVRVGSWKHSPRGNQSELLHPPFLCQSHRGLRCVLHELIPPKLDCLCSSNQSFVNYHFGNDSPIIGKQNHNIVEEHHKLEITR